MARGGEAASKRALADALACADTEGLAIPRLLPELRRELEADQALAFGLSPEEPFELDFCATDGVRPGFAEHLSAWLISAPRRFDLFDPLHPEPRQRNCALRCEDVPGPGAYPASPFSGFLRRSGLAPEVVRLLVCDGPVLLAWVGALREEPFTSEHCQRLQRMAPALRRRLRLERQLGATAMRAAALPAVLEAVPTAAFLLGPTGTVRQANRAGEALLRKRGKAVRLALRTQAKRSTSPKPKGSAKASGPRAPSFVLHVISAPGLPAHHLALERPAGNPLDRGVALAAARWGLSDKVEGVLALLVRGLSNRAIGARLRYADGTVELYVSRILAAAGVDSRAALLAKFFMEAT
ncbi:MAG: helix-turn-helix transcriptional regulator [Myxococcales bacterium]